MQDMPTLIELVEQVNAILRAQATLEPTAKSHGGRVLDVQYHDGKRLIGFDSQLTLALTNQVFGVGKVAIHITDSEGPNVEVALYDPQLGQYVPRPGVPTAVGDRIDYAGRMTSAIANALYRFGIAADAWNNLIYLPLDSGEEGVEFLPLVRVEEWEPPEDFNPDVLSMAWDGTTGRLKDGATPTSTNPSGSAVPSHEPTKYPVSRRNLELHLSEHYRQSLPKVLLREEARAWQANKATPDGKEVESSIVRIVLTRDLLERCVKHGWDPPMQSGKDLHPAARAILVFDGDIVALRELPYDQLAQLVEEVCS